MDLSGVSDQDNSKHATNDDSKLVEKLKQHAQDKPNRKHAKQPCVDYMASLWHNKLWFFDSNYFTQTHNTQVTFNVNNFKPYPADWNHTYYVWYLYMRSCE